MQSLKCLWAVAVMSIGLSFAGDADAVGLSIAAATGRPATPSEAGKFLTYNNEVQKNEQGIYCHYWNTSIPVVPGASYTVYQYASWNNPSGNGCQLFSVTSLGAVSDFEPRTTNTNLITTDAVSVPAGGSLAVQCLMCWGIDQQKDKVHNFVVQ